MQRIIRNFPVATVKRVSLRVSGERGCGAQHKWALPGIIAGGKKMRGLATPQMALLLSAVLAQFAGGEAWVRLSWRGEGYPHSVTP